MVTKKRFYRQLVAYALCVCMIVGLSAGFPVSALASGTGPENSGKQMTDISGHWAESQLNTWVNKGLISGFPDETFRPNNSITRVEFMALVNRAYGFSEKAAISFSDVSKSDWFYDDVAKAVAAGYIVGYGDRTVGARNNISRQEAAAVIYRLMKLPEYSSKNAIEKFTDYGSISPWSREAVNSVVAEGYMVGNPNGTFGPVNNITRAETVVTLSRATGEIYNAAGTYSEVRTIKGNATINTAGITLDGAVVEGNLYLTPGIGDGTVVLRNVTVKGTTVIAGGGKNSVVLEDCELNKVVVSREDGIVRVSAQGGTSIQIVVVEAGAILDSALLSGDGSILTVYVTADEAVELSGDFGTVHVENPGLVINVTGGSIENLIIAETAAGSSVNLSQTASVANMEINAPVTVTGQGTIENAVIGEGAKETTFEKEPVNKEGPGSTSPSTPPGGSTGGGTGGGAQSSISVYDILFDSSGLVAGVSKQVPITLKAVTVKDEGYDSVRINVSVVSKPDNSTVALSGNYGAGPVEVITLGYWGPENGFILSKDYENTDHLAAYFSSAGEYTLRISLYDIEAKVDILVKEVSITVAALAGTVHTLSYTADTNGTLSGETTQLVQQGSAGTPVFAVADDGYEFWKWDDGSVETVRVDEDVAGNITVTALFKPLLTLEVTPNNPLMGSVTDTQNIQFMPGEIVRLQAVPKPGYRFVSWNREGTGEVESTDETYDYEMPNNNAMLFATFIAEPFVLSYAAGENGKVRYVEGDGSLHSNITKEMNYGEDGPGIQAVPNSGYMFVKWSDERRDNPRKEYDVYRNYNVTAQFVEVPDIQLAPPQMKSDTTHNYAGSDLDIYAADSGFNTSSWLLWVDEVRVDGNQLTANQYSKQLGRIVLKTSAIVELQSPGPHTIQFIAPGYAPSTFTQEITAGLAHQLVIDTQPEGTSGTEGFFGTPPVIHVKDQYGNLCADGPSAQTEVTAAKHDNVLPGTWALTGTTTLPASGGVVEFANLIVTNTTEPLPVSFSGAQLSFSFSAFGHEDTAISSGFTVGSGANPFNGAWVYPDTTDNYAGNTLELDYSLGQPGAWDLMVTMKVGGVSISRFVTKPIIGTVAVWHVSTADGTITIDTQHITALQKQGVHKITFECAGYETAHVMQPITAGLATGLKVFNQPMGPASAPGSDPQHPKPLRMQPEVVVVDAYDNICYNGPSKDETYHIYARSLDAYYGDASNWYMDTKIKPTVNGTASFWFDNEIEVQNSTRSDVTNARIIFTSAGLDDTISEPFTVPRGVHESPEMVMEGMEENSILAGQPIIVRVYGKTAEWVNATGKEVWADGVQLTTSMGDNAQFRYVPDFSSFVIHPRNIEGLTRRGSHTIEIRVPGYAGVLLDFHVNANHAYRMVPDGVVIGPNASNANTGQILHFVSPLKVRIEDQWGNLCVDGPSAAGVTVSVSKTGDKEKEWEFVSPPGTRSVGAVNGMAVFNNLRVNSKSERDWQNIHGALRVTSPGLDSLTVSFPIAHWWVKYYGATYHNITPDTTNNTAGETIEVTMNVDLSDQARLQDWYDSLLFVTVDGYYVHGAFTNPSVVSKNLSGNTLTLTMDTRHIPQLQKAGTHTIKVYSTLQRQNYFHEWRYHESWSPASFQQVIRPAEPHVIEVVEQPEALTQGSGAVQVAVQVKDVYGNLVPCWVEAAVNHSLDAWIMGGTHSVYAADGTANFHMIATNTIAKDKTVGIVFDVDREGGYIRELSRTFYLPGVAD